MHRNLFIAEHDNHSQLLFSCLVVQLFILFLVSCFLFVVCCLLFVVCCLLFVVRCLFSVFIAYCLLIIAHCLLNFIRHLNSLERVGTVQNTILEALRK